MQDARQSPDSRTLNSPPRTVRESVPARPVPPYPPARSCERPSDSSRSTASTTSPTFHGIAVRIAKRHRDVNDGVEPGRLALVRDLSPVRRSRLPESGAGCSAKMSAKPNRETQSPDRLGGNGPLRALLVDHDPDNFNIIGRIEFFQYFLRIGHLRNGFRRDKRNRIDVLEPRADQGLQIVRLDVSRNLPFQPLPGIARTLNEFYGIGHTQLHGRGSTRDSHGLNPKVFLDPCRSALIRGEEEVTFAAPQP